MRVGCINNRIFSPALARVRLPSTLTRLNYCFEKVEKVLPDETHIFVTKFIKKMPINQFFSLYWKNDNNC